MRKLLLGSLFLMSSLAFAGEGALFFEQNSWNEVYVSLGCTVKSSEYASITGIEPGAVPLVKGESGFYEIPYSELQDEEGTLQDFCFYGKTVNYTVGEEIFWSYPSTNKFSAAILKEQSEVFILNSGTFSNTVAYRKPKDIVDPVLMLRAPSWSNIYLYGFRSYYDYDFTEIEEPEQNGYTAITLKDYFIDRVIEYPQDTFVVYKDSAFIFTDYSVATTYRTETRMINNVSYNVAYTSGYLEYYYSYYGVSSAFNRSSFAGRDTIWVEEDPYSPGKTLISDGPIALKTLYVLIPVTEDWFANSPAISFDGGKTLHPMKKDSQSGCGWFKITLPESDIGPSGKIYAYADTSISFGKNLKSSTSFDLPNIYKALKSEVAYFVPYDLVSWTSYKPDKTGDCYYNFTGIIYDSDETVNPFFSSYPDNMYWGNCAGVHKGIVKDKLNAKTKKPDFNTGNSNAALCAGSEQDFKTLFNVSEGVNEASCYDFMFSRQSDGRWGYDSDSAVYDGYVGGFAPVEDKTDDDVFSAPLPEARTKRSAEGPVSVNYAGDYEKFCNTAGWNGGVDCEGMLETDGDGLTWNWGSRWTGYRNQQFCFESHAQFTYKKGQSFTVIGDDDIWVFIAGKLAVDHGGAHLATPGYVDLSLLTDLDGNPLKVGERYDFDFFFCDRRTTMSNMTLKTNIYLTQKEVKKYLSPCKIPDQDVMVSEEDVEIEDYGYVGDDVEEYAEEKREEQRQIEEEEKKKQEEEEEEKPEEEEGDDDDEDGIITNAPLKKYRISLGARSIRIMGYEKARFSVMDMQGRMLSHGVTTPQGSSIVLNHAGNYLVRIGSVTKQVTIR